MNTALHVAGPDLDYLGRQLRQHLTKSLHKHFKTRQRQPDYDQTAFELCRSLGQSGWGRKRKDEWQRRFLKALDG